MARKAFTKSVALMTGGDALYERFATNWIENIFMKGMLTELIAEFLLYIPGLPITMFEKFLPPTIS